MHLYDVHHHLTKFELKMDLYMKEQNKINLVKRQTGPTKIKGE